MIIKKFRKSSNAFTLAASGILLIVMSLHYSCGANIFSVKDDVDIGNQINEEIKNTPTQYPVLKGHQDIKNYVSGLGKYV